MPPPTAHKTLTARQKETLKRWIEQGAGYQQHWAYEMPIKAEIRSGQNGVDVLVRQRLAELGLKPAPEADRRTLIRRLYFDLLGLPPTPEEVAEFVSDTSPHAYENLVEQLLNNPHYGERMAIGWLDVVRFADTIGYHSDTPRNVWPYRDWVIKSFNDNKRFDRFTLEQIAGDLLPDASQETRVGSAFNRLLLTTEEGGAQAKDYEQRMLTDRVRAIGAAWLGQTTGCAQCHDHKFDPFTQRDFYATRRILCGHQGTGHRQARGRHGGGHAGANRSARRTGSRAERSEERTGCRGAAARYRAAAMGARYHRVWRHTARACQRFQGERGREKNGRAGGCRTQAGPDQTQRRRRSKHCKPTSARRRPGCLPPSAKPWSRQSRNTRPFTTRCPSAWSASAARTSAPCGFCRAATGWTRAAR